MGTFKSFEDIEAWQKARSLAREIYEVSNRGLFAKDFGLRDQIRRASVSIMSNIAEGFERGGAKEFGRFLAIAKGSAGEVRAEWHLLKHFRVVFCGSELARDIRRAIASKLAPTRC